MKQIADTGLIVALLAEDDPYHAWAAHAFRNSSPFYTCDAVVAEACSFFPTPRPVLTLLARGDLQLAFDLSEELPHVLALATKYQDRPMDLADACLVRMTELYSRAKLWTVDRRDFHVYRRHGRKPIPCEFPPEP